MQKILTLIKSLLRPAKKAGAFHQRFNSHWPNRDQSQWNGGRFLNAEAGACSSTSNVETTVTPVTPVASAVTVSQAFGEVSHREQ